MKADKGAYNLVLLMINALAYRVSQKQVYVREFDALYDTGTWQSETAIDFWKREGVVEKRVWEYNIHNKFASAAAEIILDILPERISPVMEQTIATWWRIWKYGVGEDLLPFYHYKIRFQEDIWEPLPRTQPKPREEWVLEDSFLSYTSQVRWTEPLYRSLYTSMVSAKYAPHIRQDAVNLAKRILEAVDGLRLRWIIDPDGRQLEPCNRVMENVLSSEGPSTYLIGFWRGRVENLW